MAVDFKVNMDDERLKAIDNEEATAVKNSNATYDTMIKNSDKFYKDQINESKNWEKQQTQLQQEQTDFAIQKIEQQKEQAHKDYLKEQKGAYADLQKQTDRYGVQAEQMADMGMGGTGYSETVQAGFHNQYQNRVAVARESYLQIKTDYDNAMTEAKIQNNAVLAEIAHQAQQTRLELALNQFQYNNTLISEKASKQLELNKYYDSKWQTVLDQINRENQLAYQQEQDEIKNQQTQAQIQLQQDRLDEEIRQFNILHPTLPAVSGSSGGSSSGGSSKNTKSNSKSSSKNRTERAKANLSKVDNASKNGAKKASGTKSNTTKNKTMLDIIMSDPKYLPAAVKKKLGLSK